MSNFKKKETAYETESITTAQGCRYRSNEIIHKFIFN